MVRLTNHSRQQHSMSTDASIVDDDLGRGVGQQMSGLVERWDVQTRPCPAAHQWPISRFIVVHAAGSRRSLVYGVLEKC